MNSQTTVPRAYIARYFYEGIDFEREEIIFRAPYWNDEISAEWDRLMAERKAGDPKLMGWYCNSYQTTLVCMVSQFGQKSPNL